MNCLIVAQRLPYPPNKGEKIRTFHQIEYLASLGHTVHVICPTESESDHENAKLLAAKSDNINVKLVDIGNRKLKLLIGLITNCSLSVANFYVRHMQFEVDKLLIEKKIDVVLCTASSMAEYVFNSTPITDYLVTSKLVMDFMDLDSDKWRQYAKDATWPMSWIYSREYKILSRYERKIHHYFDECFFVAQQEVVLFSSTLDIKNKCKAIGNGIDTDTFKPVSYQLKPSEPVFLFTGVMDYAPNIDAVVWFVEHVWGKIKAQYPAAKFYIAGMNPTKKVLELAKQDGIEVTGFVQDIMPYFDQANLFVAPFRIARGVQNKVLQAFACGLPVISTSMGADGIACEHGEHLIISDDANDFANQALSLIDDPKRAESLGLAAHGLIHKQFSWQGVLAPLEALLTKTEKS